MNESVREVASEGAAVDAHHARVARRALAAAEAAAEIEFEVPLKLRNFAELQARVATGETIPAAEIAAKYLPLASDYSAAVAWLQSQGLTVTLAEGGQTIFGRASVSQLRAAFATEFARVSYEGGEFTSAIAAPTVPAELAAVIVGVNGLQPHLQLRRHLRRMDLHPQSLSSSNPPYLPSQIIKAYGGAGLGFTGSGQTIAIVGETVPSSSDLTTFWSDCGIAQSSSNVTTVQVVSGTLPASSTDAGAEATLDTEWASALAPAAKVRIYATVDANLIHFDQAYSRIISDAAAITGLRQVSISYGSPEVTGDSISQARTDDQYFAQMAAAGISVFVSSGDGGSNPSSSGAYSATATLQVESPASDPYVTAVGGTSLTLNSSTGAASSENAWIDGGGGASVYVSRPSWQTGTGIVSGTARLVPDVASAGDPNTGAFLVWNGSNAVVGGTSWSAPTWAGFCAMINQARVANGLASVGLLNSKIYPLQGTSSFRDITSGSNGAYTAKAGYDECTGLGVPNLANLIVALGGSAPTTTTTGTTGGTTTSGSGTTTTTGTGTTGSTGTTTSTGGTTSSGGGGTTTSSGGTTSTGTSGSGTTSSSGGTTSTGGSGAGTTSSGGTTTTTTSAPVVNPPVIFSQPTSVAVAFGGTASFNVAASGTAPFTYQWYKGSAAISGANSATLTLSNVQGSDAAVYKVSVSNSAGTASSSGGTLAVNLAPVVVTAPSSQIAFDGAGATLNVGATGPGLSYQWNYNGAPITGATSSSFTLSNLTAPQAGVYSVTISNSSGSVTVSALVAVETTARMVNISSRAQVDPSHAMTAGFVISGSAAKQILLRAVGPGLAAFGVPNALAQPEMTVFDATGATLDNGAAWDGSAAMSAIFNNVGAFPLAQGSADVALARLLLPGSYTTEVSGNGGTGIALVEVYDEDLLSSPSQLVNLSCRANVGTGANVMTSGFVIAGSSSETVLIRGIGPTLGIYGVSGALAHPALTVFDGNNDQIAQNSGWASSLAPIFARVGAFALPQGSADCAVLLNLAPGSYTVQLSGVNATTGAGLVEVYAVE